MAKTRSSRFNLANTLSNAELMNALNALDDLNSGVQTLTPTAADTVGVNMIDNTSKLVRLGANVTDVNDFVTLPALATVPNGYRITIIAGAANCEVRTPAASNEKSTTKIQMVLKNIS